MRGPGLRFADVTIPERDLSWSFDPSGGPGGQHANRSSTRVTLSLDLNAASGLSESARQRLMARLGGTARDGVVAVTVDETRSQWRNRAIARRRLGEVLERASLPARTRHRTQPTAASRRRRAADKRHRSQIKRLRRSPSDDD
jgi:ribosome-associated protein